jgi:hypothetical protein
MRVFLTAVAILAAWTIWLLSGGGDVTNPVLMAIVILIGSTVLFALRRRRPPA